MSSFNKLAKLICEKEGLKKQVNIAQVKEILKIITNDEIIFDNLCLLVKSKRFGPSIIDSLVMKELTVELILPKILKNKNANRKQKTISKNKIYIVGAGGCGGGGGGGGGGPIRGVRIRTTKQK